MLDLGRHMFSQNVVLRGRLDEPGWRKFLLDCIAAMGMTEAGDAAVWRYPNEAGAGGEGVTICQPMTESFIVVDTWDVHDGAYLHISSCRRFNVADLVAPARAVGLGMDNVPAMEVLGL